MTFYRQLKYSESIVGAWCEYSHIHFLDCAILPGSVNPADYSGSLVNIITPYAFLKQIIDEGHKGIISTAGTSATGIALLGFCLMYDFPLISVVRSAAGRKELEALGAKNIVVQSDENFNQQLTDMAQTLNTTAIFDGAGGRTISNVLPAVPRNSVVYSYGFIGDNDPFTFHTSMLAVKNVIIKPFANTSTETVKNPEKLAQAVKDIAEVIHMPHFRTKIGQRFSLDQISEAIAFISKDGGKAVLMH